MLFLVPTPVGNLEDMTFRAIRVLKEVDLILAEDTRNTGKLLKHFNINTSMRSFHAHNEHKSIESIVRELASGKQMALVSDAGTPGISDPGFLLARACHMAGVGVQALPGATAFVPALVASGLPSDRFFFEGFLPQKKGRQTRLVYLSELPYTFILYESPYRLIKALQQLAEYCGEDRQACVCREISKLHEEVRPGSLSELADYYATDGVTKGEIVIVVAGK